jgi:hypothetical protein
MRKGPARQELITNYALRFTLLRPSSRFASEFNYLLVEEVF